MLKSFIKRVLPEFGKKWLYNAGVYNTYKPAIGTINYGDMDRVRPFSTEFGFDRGGPVDRFYIENFLLKEAGQIKGRCLEIGDNEYTLLYGKDKVIQSDILHVNESNTKATFIGDLSDAPQIADNLFDCIVLTQTLHLIYDFKAALATCHRILKPGGTLLLTTPGITPIDHGGWKSTWYWSFTEAAIIKLAAETFPEADIETGTFGNVFTATAFLYGLGITEVSTEKLNHHDPHFQVTITLKAKKKSA
jgi:SAM-dependent methyltransferase